LPKTVLLVDDDPLLRRVMADDLRAAGYHVTVASDGLEALERVRKSPPDFILLDVIMPKLDGMRACRILKRHPEHRGIPVVLLTGLGREGIPDLEGLGAEASVAKRQPAATIHEILRTLKHLETSRLAPQAPPDTYSGLAERRIVSELLAERRHTQTLLNTLREGVVEMDERGQVVYINAAGLAMLGRPEEEVFASAGADLLGVANAQGLQDALDEVQGVGDVPAVRLELPYGHKTIEVTLTGLQRPEAPPGALLVLRDLTDLTRRTRSLRALAAVSQHILGKLDLGAALREVVTRTAELVGAERCALFRTEGPGGPPRAGTPPRLRCVEAFGFDPKAAPGAAFGPSDGEAVVHQAVVERRAVCTAVNFPAAVPEEVALDARPPGAETGPAVLAAPIVSSREAFGVLAVYRPAEHLFSRDEIELVASLAGSAAIAIENARLFLQEHERRRQVEAVRALTAEINRELDLPALLELITWRAVELLGAGCGTLWLWEEEAQALHLRASHGLGDWAGPLRLSLGQGIAGTAAQHRQGMIVNNVAAWPGPERVLPERARLGAVLAEPLLYRDRLLGVITLHHAEEGRTFGPAARETFAPFVAQAGVAIANAHLYAKVRDYSQALERKVEARTRELHALNNELEAVNRELETVSRHKSEFLANMSHELRTPLHSILGFSDLLLGVPGGAGFSPGELNDRQAHYLRNIRSSAERLLELITDVLDLAKVEAGRMTLALKEIPLPPALEQAVSLAGPQALEKNLTLELRLEDVPATVVVDPRKFQQILGNLLSNAIKFTPSGGRVTVEACRLPDARGDLLELSVRDTGIGIAPEDHHRLFQEFEQLDNSLAKRHPGTGLGLALTKRLVEMHGGCVWALSAGANRGSTFTVRLPCRPVSLPADVRPPHDSRCLAGADRAGPAPGPGGGVSPDPKAPPRRQDEGGADPGGNGHGSRECAVGGGAGSQCLADEAVRAGRPGGDRRAIGGEARARGRAFLLPAQRGWALMAWRATMEGGVGGDVACRTSNDQFGP
jgi:signal transduction histidine kinase/CheY-like chemotaxis protein